MKERKNNPLVQSCTSAKHYTKELSGILEDLSLDEFLDITYCIVQWYTEVHSTLQVEEVLVSPPGPGQVKKT